MIRTIIISMLIAASFTFAADIFGPVIYMRTWGPPDEYDTSFVAYDTSVPCTLVIINGDEAGEHRLSVASVEFNGVEIIKERDFNQRVGEIVRVISLESTNNFHFRLRSGSGDFLTVSVHRPCNAVVSLSVDTVIADSACFTADARGWGKLTYYWDFDGDGETDTTTAENAICHTYEESDTYLVKVKVEDEVGCEGEDSAEVVVIVGYHYTFEVDSSYTPWSYTFADTMASLAVANASDDGRVVALAFSKDPVKAYADHYIYVEGMLTHVFENIHRVFISHSGDKILVKPRTAWDDVDWSGGRVYCFTSAGDTIWGAQYSRFDPIWSPNDSFIGLFTGEGALDDMPATEGDFMNEIELDVTRILRIADANNGNTVAEVPIHKYGILYLGTFRKDMGGFILYKTICDPFAWGPVSENDTLEIYDTREERFDLVNKVLPMTPPNDTVYGATCLTGTYASFDHRIYLSWGWRPKVPDPNGYYTQYVCLDSLGNLIWKKEDTTKAHARYYSESGKYLLEFELTLSSPGVITLRETATNEILFETMFPTEGGLHLAGLWEHPETGHFFVVAIANNGEGKVFYPDGSIIDFGTANLILADNPLFAHKVEGSTLTFYKVRW